MYMIFNLDPDGDCYSLHGKIEEARYIFDQKVKKLLTEGKNLLVTFRNTGSLFAISSSLFSVYGNLVLRMSFK